MPSADDALIHRSIQLGVARAQGLVSADAAVAFAPSAGILVAEGDSWFDYPLFQDIVEALEKDHHYRVRSTARFGDTAESMAYDAKQLDRFRRLFKELAESGEPEHVPKGVLLSCGGNDIVNAFGILLNHRQSGLDSLNEDAVRGLLDVRLKAAISSLISSVLVFCNQYFSGRSIPIVIHGYGHAVPDGRGFPLGVAGPWLKPAFAARGFVSGHPQAAGELAQNAALIANLIDRFNDRVLNDLARHAAFTGKVRYVDLRPVFSNSIGDGGYLTTWRDEMHATRAAFAEAATLIARAFG